MTDLRTRLDALKEAATPVMGFQYEALYDWGVESWRAYTAGDLLTREEAEEEKVSECMACLKADRETPQEVLDAWKRLGGDRPSTWRPIDHPHLATIDNYLRGSHE